jgi:hypothetical protein
MTDEEQSSKDSKGSDFMKKILTVGVGTIFLTEESLRNLVKEFKLPKEFLAGALESAGKTKREFLQSLSSDVMSRVSEKMDPRELLQEVLSKNEIDLQIKVRFSPRDKKKPKEEEILDKEGDELS